MAVTKRRNSSRDYTALANWAQTREPTFHLQHAGHLAPWLPFPTPRISPTHLHVTHTHPPPPLTTRRDGPWGRNEETQQFQVAAPKGSLTQVPSGFEKHNLEFHSSSLGRGRTGEIRGGWSQSYTQAVAALERQDFVVLDFRWLKFENFKLPQRRKGRTVWRAKVF